MDEMPVDRLVRDVQAPRWEAVEPVARLLPGECRSDGVIVIEVGWHREVGWVLVDHAFLQVDGIHVSAIPASEASG
jgi:hypothetical protein